VSDITKESWKDISRWLEMATLLTPF